MHTDQGVHQRPIGYCDFTLLLAKPDSNILWIHWFRYQLRFSKILFSKWYGLGYCLSYLSRFKPYTAKLSKQWRPGSLGILRFLYLLYVDFNYCTKRTNAQYRLIFFFQFKDIFCSNKCLLCLYTRQHDLLYMTPTQ